MVGSAEEVEAKAQAFLEKSLKLVQEAGIDLGRWPIDHICYRTSSLDNYKLIKDGFSQLGALLVESEINGRMIATYKLFKPITHENYVIELIEVPAPKAGKTTKEGFEHFEVVIDISFEEMMSRYPALDFSTKGMAKEINPDLEYEMGEMAVKFHHNSLEDIIRLEKQMLAD